MYSTLRRKGEDMGEEDLSGIATVADLVRYLKSKLDD